ncbi:MAG: hypothetical protein WCR31_12730 [Treponema sp.]|jgi:hypothetical protein
METKLLSQIASDVDALHIRHGSCSIELQYHDGRVVFYTLNSSIRKNVDIIPHKNEREDRING